ncbi:MAG: DJ-1/PfpI family protein, partial [Sphingomicrobium sp.]
MSKHLRGQRILLDSSKGISARVSGRVPVVTRRGDLTMPQIPESRVLIVATDGFEEWELFGPRQILQDRGAEVVLASPKRDPIQGTIHDDP